MPKNDEMLKPLWNVKKSKKLAQGSPKGAPDANDRLLLAARVPRPAPRATRKVETGQLARGKKARGKEGKWKSGTNGKVEWKRRKKEKEEGSNTPVGPEARRIFGKPIKTNEILIHFWSKSHFPYENP